MIRTGWLVVSLASCLLSIMLFGCGGGGGGGGVTGEPDLQSSVMVYDFGFVTPLNSPAAKEIILSNNGNATLEISSIDLSGTGFVLDLDSEANFCGSTPLTIAANGKCSITVNFAPTRVELYSDTLTVDSNDPDNPTLAITLDGSGVAVTLDNETVRINQVEPGVCPSMTAYVSVTDTAGYPISNLPMSSFTLTETFGGSITPMAFTLNFVAQVIAPISVALVMDYSFSITTDTPVVEAMEDGVTSFINELGANDKAEIVKFDTEVEVVQPFTSDKGTLIDAVTTPWDMGTKTRIYDAVYQAVTDAAVQPTDRRAVIVLSDGFDDDGTDNQLSVHTLQEVIDHAATSGVPVFTVGIGDKLQEDILTTLSAETGGQYFNAPRAENLRTIYQQQAEILFIDQYVLTYDSAFAIGGFATLEVGVDLDEQDPQSPVGTDSRLIEPCPTPP